MSSAARELRLTPESVTGAEALLLRTRSDDDVPAALIIEHEFALQVQELNLVALLRRRKHLAGVPLIYVGPHDNSVQSSVFEAGADLYLTMPTSPETVRAALRRLLSRRQSELAVRQALERLRDFEQAYKESERVKDDLIHMLVHDLKSPISSVIGLLDHSLDMIRGQDAAAVSELLALARSESQHLLGLAANILDVRRMKEGAMPFEPSWIDDLEELARKSLQDVSGSPRNRNFSFVVAREARRVYADSGLLRRIIANLLANAVKHTRSGGYIDFRAWQEDGHWILSVRDDGEGIPEADQQRIFNAFQQSRHTVHDRYDSGMGLTFCKLATEKHGGRIWVNSRVGAGSTFFISLPMRVTDPLLDYAFPAADD